MPEYRVERQEVEGIWVPVPDEPAFANHASALESAIDAARQEALRAVAVNQQPPRFHYRVVDVQNRQVVESYDADRVEELIRAGDND
jgi:hypothetical protein